MPTEAGAVRAWETFPLVPRHRLRGLELGSTRGAQRGLGSEVAAIRPYEPGDDIRKIDWPASARLSAAHASVEFLVREHDADLALRVVVITDHRPGMGLYPSPWLSKSAAVAEVERLVARSALRQRALVGGLELRSESIGWRAPGGRLGSTGESTAEPLPCAGDELARALQLLARERPLPAGSFVFVVSDFLAPLPEEALVAAIGRRLDVVPVVVRDPTWEASFPDAVGGLVLPLVDPAGRLPADVRVGVAEARARRAANEARHGTLLARLGMLGLDPIALGTAEPDAVFAALLGWAEGRLARAGRVA